MALQVPRDGLEQKLQKVSQSQQSIESVSSFCIFYHKDARGVVSVWDQQFYTAPTDRKIALLYLANHILQEGRKKSTGFQEEFFKVLPGCITHLAKSGDEKTKRVISRLVNVWEERRVFGTRHIKAFKDVLGATASSRQPKQPTAAAPAGNAAITAAAVPKLGPVDDALSAALAKAADAAAKGKGFTSSWSQDLLTNGSLADVTACHSKLSSFSAALQEEVAARQAAVAALNAELARQNAELNRSQSQLSNVGAQKAQLDQRLVLLTNQMSSAMASLGQMFQNGGGAAAGSAAAGVYNPLSSSTDGGAAGDVPRGVSPEAPDLEQEMEDDFSDYPPQVSQPAPTLQPVQQQQQQQSQQAPVLSHDLQALLQNPQLLSAAITGSIPAGPPPVRGGGSMMQIPTDGAADGMQLQLPSGPVMRAASSAAAAAPWAAGTLGAGMGGGYNVGGGGGFGSLAAGMDEQQFGFADEADDPYDPEHPD